MKSAICLAVIAAVCSGMATADMHKHKYANVASATAKGSSHSYVFEGEATTDTYTDAHAECKGADCFSEADAKAGAVADAYEWWGSYAASYSESDAEVDIADAKILSNKANIVALTEAFGEDADAKADADASANGYAYIWKKGGVSPPQPPPAPPAHPWGKKKWGKKKSWGKKKPSKWHKPKWGWKSKDE